MLRCFDCANASLSMTIACLLLRLAGIKNNTRDV